jgi:O-antigen ligase
MGQFDSAQDLWSRESSGHKGGWQPTHNTFTQLSSEIGIPGLLLYCAAIVAAFRATAPPRPSGRWVSREEQEMCEASFCLHLSLVAFCVSAWFASFAYQTQFLTLAGMSVAYARAFAPALAAARARPEPTVPDALPYPERLTPKLQRRTRALARRQAGVE